MPPAVALPIVKPLIVTLNALAAPMLAPDTFSTTDVLDVLPLKIFSTVVLPALTDTKGVMDGTKNFGGYVKVIEPGELIALPGKNERNKLAFDLLAMRSEIDMLKMRISDRKNPGNPGKIMSLCVCSGVPLSSKVDTVTPVLRAFPLVSVNPGIEHTTKDATVAARTAVDMVSNRTPEDGEKLDVILAGGLILEQ